MPQQDDVLADPTVARSFKDMKVGDLVDPTPSMRITTMKRFYACPCSAPCWGGCAGSASEFECNATTSDRCMTMEQANEMARKKTEGDTRERGCGRVARPG